VRSSYRLPSHIRVPQKASVGKLNTPANLFAAADLTFNGSCHPQCASRKSRDETEVFGHSLLLLHLGCHSSSGPVFSWL